MLQAVTAAEIPQPGGDRVRLAWRAVLSCEQIAGILPAVAGGKPLLGLPRPVFPQQESGLGGNR